MIESGPTRAKTRRRHLTGCLAGAVATVLVATLLPPPPAQAAEPKRSDPPATQKTRSVRGRGLAAETLKSVDRRAVSQKGAVWPAAGAASVALSTAAPAGLAPGTRRIRAGTLPLWIGPAATPAAKRVSGVKALAPGKVRVEVAGQDVADRLGMRGVVFKIAREDGVKSAGRAKVEFDYSTFASAVGGDWASRLRLVSLPACALTTPSVPRCQTGTAIPSRNNAKTRRVSGDVTVPAASGQDGSQASSASADRAVFALAAGPSGGAGSYAATSLAPSATWQVSQQTGDFSWSYPLRVPPGVNGPSPKLSISYSSGSVDGRTASTNNQASWLGEGHSIESGYIERKYVSCRDDQGAGANNTTKTGDQCWKTDNANVVLAGHSGELVKAANGAWRLENDDASKIERLYGAPNDDNDKEYWRLTTTDGTQYFFGLGKRYATDSGPNTDSTWTVPVFGNHASEPCHAETFAASSCQQAWRWNLDYVVDPHGNTMTYYYASEKNNYGRNNNTAVSTYDRGGWLKEIEYGERKGTEGSTWTPAQVVFTVAERCLPSGAITCAEAQLTKANAIYWPDVPQDQICTSTTTCPDQKTPSFFTRKRLVGVTTQVQSGTNFLTVDSWTFAQRFPNPGDGTSPALWLDSITHTGKVGGSAVLPPITFLPEQLYNRVDGLDIAPPLIKMRVAEIRSETGSRISVNYPSVDCAPGNVPAQPHANTRDCFPVYWAADGQEEPTVNYFHKYPVSSVVEDDLTGGGLDKVTEYKYLGGGAWHYDDNELTLPKHRTYGQWRGYGEVEVRTGTKGQGLQTLTKSKYMRGMNGDRLPDGAKRSASVIDSKGGTIVDHARASGFLREQITYNGDGGAEVSGTINTPWISAPTAGSGDKAATILQTGKVRGRTRLAGGGDRTTETSTTFDAYGLPTTVDDRGDTAIASDDVCTRTVYARNTASWILAETSQVETVSVNCATTPSRPAQVVSDARMYYDGSGTLGAVPGKGNLTRTETLSDGGLYETTFQAKYDEHGRVVESSDALNRVTTVAYTPVKGGPVTETATTNPMGHISKTVINTAWGVPQAEIDVNEKRTDLAYDPLGRLTSVWLPDRPRATNEDSPHMKFSYLVRNNGAVAVSTSQLRNNGSYTTSYALFDGLLRQRQSQTPSADGTGRVITETIYDNRGQVLDSNGPFYNRDAPSSDLFQPATDVQFEAQTRNTYDGAGRLAVQAFRVLGVEKWRTTTTYGGDRVTVDPPTGTPPTTAISDARGRTTALRQYRATSPTGAYEETTYTHTPDGRAKTITDPAGNVWSYEYDQRGRQTRANDPDRGTTVTTYDDADQVTTVTDARGQKLAYAYDLLGRRTAVHKDSLAGAKLSSWVFDAVRSAEDKPIKGQVTSSTRWMGENAYTTTVTGYDAMYRPTGSKVTIPANEGELAGDYDSALTYNVDGGIKEMSLPAAPGLPTEKLSLKYDDLGQLKITNGHGAYVNGTKYSPFGEVLQLTLGNMFGKFSWQTFAYEQGTRRLKQATVQREALAGTASDVDYSYDPAGNVTKISDTGTDQAADTQCFSYDHLRRLTQAWTPTNGCAAAPSTALLGGPAPYWHSYDYDVTGNRTKEVQHAPAGDTTRTYEYPDAKQPKPHGLTKVTTDSIAGQRLETFEYDDVGNTTVRSPSGDKQTLTWDAEGHVSSATDAKGKTEYVYDASGVRLIRRDPTATTLYLDGTEIKLERVSKAKTSTRYYTHNGMTVAVRTSAGVQFLASDHHGTAEVAIDGATQAVTRRRSLPFGGPREASPAAWAGDRGFVGGTIDASTGLMHLGAREYDPDRGRFISVDPVIDYADPQQMNGYSYANNNPTTLSDPTGLSPEDAQFNDGNGCASCDKAAEQRYGKGRKATPQEVQDSLRNQVNSARQNHERVKKKIIKIALSLVKIAADELGITAGLNCFTKGDIGACAETALNVASMFVGGLLGKLVTKYAWRWKTAARLIGRLKDLGSDFIDSIGGWFKSRKRLARAENALEAAGGSCSIKKSFPPGTKVVLANGKMRSIEKLAVGDKVVATDPASRRTEARAVVATHIREGSRHLVEVTVDTDGARGNKTGRVIATDNHEFWVDDQGAWIPAGQLAPGHKVRTPSGGRLVVTATRHWTAHQRVHNLTIEGIHTYYVRAGDIPVLVHNCGGEYFRGARPDDEPSFAPRPNDFKVDAQTGLVKETHGVSVFDNAESVSSKGFVAHRIDMSTVPSSLRIIQRGRDPRHYEIVPRSEANLSPQQYSDALCQIQCVQPGS